jgi:hypothetical protein
MEQTEMGIYATKQMELFEAANSNVYSRELRLISYVNDTLHVHDRH